MSYNIVTSLLSSKTASFICCCSCVNKTFYWTCLAVVAGFEVSSEVFRARLDEMTYARNRQLAAPPTGAGAIQHVDDVSRASKETVVT